MSHVLSVPDLHTAGGLLTPIRSDPDFTLIRTCKEDETFGIAAGHNRHPHATADKARALVPHGVFVLTRSQPATRDSGGTVEEVLTLAVWWVAALNADLVTLDPSEVA